MHRSLILLLQCQDQSALFSSLLMLIDLILIQSFPAEFLPFQNYYPCECKLLNQPFLAELSCPCSVFLLFFPVFLALINPTFLPGGACLGGVFGLPTCLPLPDPNG